MDTFRDAVANTGSEDTNEILMQIGQQISKQLSNADKGLLRFVDALNKAIEEYKKDAFSGIVSSCRVPRKGECKVASDSLSLLYFLPLLSLSLSLSLLYFLTSQHRPRDGQPQFFGHADTLGSTSNSVDWPRLRRSTGWRRKTASSPDPVAFLTSEWRSPFAGVPLFACRTLCCHAFD